MFRIIKKISQLVFTPRALDTREELQEKWDALPEKLQSDQQIYGRNEEGCGATVGMMPRCDFACRGCYLSESANKVPAASVSDIKKQLDHLRSYLGRWGNLQLTDGEVTLRPVNELIEILKYAREVELIPMLMTHGDQIRKNPELLKTLMREGHLAEVSFHVDITQRGRLGDAYKNAKTEAELMPLRKEFVELVRTIREETKLPLRVASTLTITPDNLNEVPDVLTFYMKNSDVFRLVSFLPIAQVGRTLDGIGGGVTKEALWGKVAEGLYKQDTSSIDRVLNSRWWMGPPDCSQFLMGFVRVDKTQPLRYYSVSMKSDELSKKVFGYFFKKFSGITFRADSKLESRFRAIGMFLSAPWLFIFQFPRLMIQTLKEMSPEPVLKQMYALFKGTLKYERFTIVGHHFMSEDELKTDLGKERLDQCVFKVSHGGELVSMCEFNATSLRQDYYHELTQQHSKE